jgi:hypothetical protein
MASLYQHNVQFWSLSHVYGLHGLGCTVVRKKNTFYFCFKVYGGDWNQMNGILITRIVSG